MAGILKDERYADRVIKGKTEHFDAIEVQGVRSEDGVHFEVDNTNPNAFSVYVHYVPSENYGVDCVDCVGDFTTREAAQQYGTELSKQYGYPVHDFTHDPR